MSVPVQTEPDAGVDVGETVLRELAERAKLNPATNVHGLILGTLLEHVIDTERRLDALEVWKYNQEETCKRNETA